MIFIVIVSVIIKDREHSKYGLSELNAFLKLLNVIWKSGEMQGNGSYICLSWQILHESTNFFTKHTEGLWLSDHIN